MRCWSSWIYCSGHEMFCRLIDLFAYVNGFQGNYNALLCASWRKPSRGNWTYSWPKGSGILMSQEIDLWVIDSYTKKVPTIKDSKSRRCCNNSVGKSPRRKKEREHFIRQICRIIVLSITVIRPLSWFAAITLPEYYIGNKRSTKS